VSRTRLNREDSEAISLDEAAALLGVHRLTLLRGIERGEVRAVRLGRRWIVPRQALEEFLAGPGEGQP
jgi:excisionase family DNA binding protein